MPDPIGHERLKTDLMIPWIIVAIILILQVVYVVGCHLYGNQLQQHLPEQQREWIRSIFYGVAIITFPLTNLIRHIMVRLNQTMPGDKLARHRYSATIIVSMSMIESMGVLGVVMFLLGDDFNTLYIFTVLVLLGLFLYRPKLNEYYRIVDALSAKNHQ